MSRYALAFITLPLVVVFERMAYYAMRVVLPMWLLRDQHLTGPTAAELRDEMGLYMGLAVLLGGVVALVIGPRLTALAGALLMAGGYVALALTDASSVHLLRWLLIVGSGLYQPAVYACAGQAMRGQAETRWALFFLVLALSTNLGAFFGSTMGGLFVGNYSGAFILSAVAATLAAGTLAGFSLIRRTEEQARTETNHKLRIGIAILWVAILPSLLLMAHADHIVVTRVEPSALASTLGAGTAVGFIVILVLIAGFLFVANQARRVVLPLIGGGLLLCAVGIAPLLIGGTAANTASVVLLAPCGVLIGQIGLARISVGTKERMSTAIVAVWLAASLLAFNINFDSKLIWNLLGADETALHAIYLVILALLCAAAGLALLKFRHRLQRSYFEPPAVADAPV